MKSLPTSYTAARKWGIILLLALASLGAALLSMSFGSTQVPFSEILTALMGGETQAYNIVVYARLPRTLAALLCGSALAVGGVIIQGVLGNPLAGPNIIGVNAGAGLGAVLCAALIPTSMTAVPVAAFLGALGACMLVYTLARRTGASRITLVLAGVAISSMLSAAIDAVSILFPEAALGAGSFMVGRLSGVTVASLKVPALLSLLAGAGAFAMSYELDLLVPHAARFLVGGEHKYLLAASLFLGAALVTVCDLAARVLFVPFELPVGILLSLMGGPFFLWLLFRQRGGRRT